MQPWPVRPEDQLARSRAAHEFHEIVEAPHARAIRMYPRMAREQVDDSLLRAPVVGETTQMRDDEVDVRIRTREHVDDISLPGDIDEQRNAVATGRLAHFARRHAVVSVHL